jgi:serine/threonine-protein kinase
MDGERDLLDKLAESVADGDSIEWDKFDQLPPDDPRRRLVDQLRVVADIAELHRSVVDDQPETARTRATAGQAAHIPGLDASPFEVRANQAKDKWGHLLLLGKIGEGAFGEVYRAHDTWLDHPVALKLLKPAVARTDFSSRILHEARRLARVRHPNVVTVHGADMNDGRVGFWMDLVEGETLSDLLSRGRLSHGEASHIGQEVCLALAAVHLANLVHRDVKAQNVMRTRDGGRIILMDFGAGEFINRPTSPDSVRGTPLYLAPELFDGAGASIATDIYAVGVLLYHLVTDQYPVYGRTLSELVDAHRRGERRRLRDVRPDLPSSFVDIVERSLDPDPKRRFPSAGEMQAALSGDQKLASTPPRDTGLNVGRTLRVTLLIAAVLATIEVLGVIASRTFEVALRVDRDFTAGPIEYFRQGIYGLIGFVFSWVVIGATLMLAAGIWPLLRPRTWKAPARWVASLNRLDPSTPATILLLVGVGGLIALSLQFSDVYKAIEELTFSPTPGSLDLSVLGPGARSIHRWHGLYSAGLSFLLGLAAWRWLPHLEKRSPDPSRVRRLKWAVVTVAFLVVAFDVAPRRLIWEDFEVASYGVGSLDKQTTFVIGSTDDLVLLYVPRAGQRMHFRAPKTNERLERDLGKRQLFD